MNESRRTASEEWKAFGSQIELDGGVGEGEVMLLDRLGREVTSSHGFAFFLSTIPKGGGYGDDYGGIALPADVMLQALDNDFIEPSFLVEIREHDGTEAPTRIGRMSMSRFLFYSSVAVNFHARFVNRRFDAWTILQQMTVSCSRKAQFERLPERVQRELRSMKTEWTSGWTSSGT